MARRGGDSPSSRSKSGGSAARAGARAGAAFVLVLVGLAAGALLSVSAGAMVGGVGVGVGVEVDEDAAADLKRMQGAWAGDSPEGMETRWTIEEDRLVVLIGDQSFEAKIALKPSARPHPAIDFALTAPPELEGKSSLGIYRIEEDKLTFCVSPPNGTKRPEAFRTEEGESYLYELRKVAKGSVDEFSAASGY